MDNSKIIRIPITRKQREINEYGEGYVPCYVSQRWLQFNTVSDIVGDTEVIMMNAMTIDKNDQPYKLFEMILEKEDLIRALKSIKPLTR